ncbi:unnamed protein product [Paramecium primaurelia]|uniref:Uncharacterized protein n=2 Tax=Paramecium TaxID=5884 RepID=A0A8S1UPX3_9CILI|nr:unnamed protein product [Paramecium primaurelia]CAD8165802.1 unnamed protein product [Paramecium pentaurelia]
MNNSSNSNSRQSAQNIINKYEQNNNEDRFTFQVRPNSPRETFGKQTQPRNSQVQILREIDQANLSKMLSDFSIVSEQEESICQNQFNNPIGIVQPQQIVQQQKQQEQVQENQSYRGTFGKNPYFQPKSEVTEIIEKSYIEEELYDDMSVLKDKVMGLLQAYADDLRKSNNDPTIRSKIQVDAKQVLKEYSQIIDKVNQSEISQLNVSQNPVKKEQELNLMSNLVTEFLNKFDMQKQPVLNVSQVLEQKLAKSRVRTSNHQLELTVMHQIPCDETFYQHDQYNDDKLEGKIQKLKQMLQDELDKQQLVFSKKILSDMISNLNQILIANDAQTVKTIIYKIENMIKQLPQEDCGSIQLYDYMSKAMKATKRKMKQMDPQNQQQEKTLKRKFFDLATQLKNKLPQDHPGRNEMISVLYDLYCQANKPVEMEDFITNQLNLVK